MKGAVKLRHCVVNQILHEVSDFAHLSPKQRPRAFCPECNGTLVLKLGNSNSSRSKAHHAAHKTENLSCSLSSPEGVLHFNTKWYIYEQLKRGNQLFINQTCGGWFLDGYKQKCTLLYSATRPYLWVENWDDVEVEKNVKNLRPDIVLYRNNQPLAAIEVCVTHAVDREKQAKLFEIGLPWIEVKAEGREIDEYFVNWANDYEDEFVPWKIEKPLIYANCYPPPEEWMCDACRTAPEEYAEALKKRDELEALREAELLNNKLKNLFDAQARARRKLLYVSEQDNRILFAKAIMLLKPFGETELLELFVVRRDHADSPYAPEELYLRQGRISPEILISEEPITEHSQNIINEFSKNWIKNKERSRQQICHLTKWLKLSEYEKCMENYTLHFEWIKFRGWVEK